jgi:hypothetical protein
MDERPLTEQHEHDLIVKAAAQKFADSEKYTIHINPGAERNAKVGGEYPDIVVTGRGSGNVKFVIEVETVSSVDSSELPQWKKFASLGPPLYILVPFRVLPIARRLCEGTGLKCHFGYYKEDDRGQVKIAFKKN